MNVELVLKNYRCFPDDTPARVSLKQPFTALIGTNNAGKSSLLKFFYEFRAFWGLFTNLSGNFQSALNGNLLGVQNAASVRDSVELFSKAIAYERSQSKRALTASEAVFERLGRCMSERKMTYAQMVAIVDKHMKDNPAQWHQEMTFLVWTAMKAACDS